MSGAVAEPVAVHRPVSAEDAARADFYALLARLFLAPPDGALLRHLAEAPSLPPEGDAALGAAWRDLVDASSVMDPQAALEEYDLLFAGLGKPRVALYAGAHVGASAVDHPRVRIRADLAALGLAPRSNEPEDHLARLFEAMRVLAAGGAGRAPASVAEQRAFFDAHVKAAAGSLFTKVGATPEANYYRTVAAFGGAFLALEIASFQLE